MVSRSARLAICSALRRALASDFDSGEESPAEEEVDEGEKLTLFFFFGFDLGFGGGAGDASDESEEVSSSKSPETPVGGPTDTGIGAATRLEGLLAFVGVVLAPLVTAGVAEDTAWETSDFRS